MTERRTLTKEEWVAEAIERFGEDTMGWKFKWPLCGHVASVRDWKDAGAEEGAVAFSCVGRWTEKPRRVFEGKGKGPCDYAGGGLFRLNPVTVISPDGSEHQVFEFAESGA